MARKTKEVTIPDSIACIAPTKIKNDLPVYADNPYISASKGFSIKIRSDLSLVGSGLEIKDKDSDEISAGVIGKVQWVDSEEFVKIYTRNVSLLFELNLTAQKAMIAVFLAVQEQSIGNSVIFLSYAKAEEYYKKMNLQPIPSQPSFSKGMKSLLKSEILAYHTNGDGWYWINPNIIFNGDRVRFVEEYRVKRKNDEHNRIQQGRLI